jgi:hypothetical protein
MSTRWWVMGLATLYTVVACGDRDVRTEAAPAVAATRTIIADGVVALCDSVAREWKHREPSASVRQNVDTLISDDDDSFVYRNAPQHRACLTVVRVEHPQGHPTPPAPGFNARPIWRPGWTEIENTTADGPGGGEQGYMRGDVRCLVRVEFDGEDDSDSTYVPADWFVETTMCWRDPQLLKR